MHRGPLRDALYAPPMRFNPDLKAKYTALRDAGKPVKVAILALMRKLLETAANTVPLPTAMTQRPPPTLHLLKDCR